MEVKVSKRMRYFFWSIFLLTMSGFILMQICFSNTYSYVEDNVVFLEHAFFTGENAKEYKVKENDLSYLYKGVEAGEKITLSTELPDSLPDNAYVAILSNEQEVWINIDGELRSHYVEEQVRFIGAYSASYVVMTPLKMEDAGKKLTVSCATSMKSTARKLSYPMIGTQRAIIMWLIKNNAAQLISAILLLTIGIVFICCGAFIRLNQRTDKGLMDLGIFSVLIAIWLFCMSNLRPLFFPNISSADLLTYCALMLCPAPIMMFFNTLLKNRYQKVYNIMIAVSLINFGVNVLFQAVGVNLTEVLLTTHITLMATCLVCLITYFKYDNKEELSDPMAVGIGMIGFVIATFVEDYNIVVYCTLFAGKYLGIGIIFFLLMLGYAAIKGMAIQEKEYREAVHASMEKSNFLANMSHEIRTPINTILGMDEMILRENKDIEIEHYADNIRNAGKTLLSIVNDILDFTKMESGKMVLTCKRYNVANLLNDLIDAVAIKTEEKGLELSLDIDEKLPGVLYGDEVKVKQAITNVLINAVKYTKYGSVTMQVHAEKKDLEETILCFDIIDTGIGIREEDQDKMFSSFVRLEEKRNRSIEGTGLGMAITKQIMDIMQGQIKIESVYGKGTKVHLSFTQKILDEEPIGKFENWYRTGHRKTRTYVEQYRTDVKLLVVDDNEMNLEVIKGLLKQTGAKIETADSGKECLRLFEKENYDLIFLDHMMPEMDGVETLHKLQQIMKDRKADVPVIALTANAISGAREEYLSCGFADYIAKPVEYKNLIEVIQSFLPDRIEKRADIKNQEEIYAEYLEKEGIHMKNALKYAGGDLHQYLHLLELFVSSRADEKERKLHEAYCRQIWKDYVVYVHGLKNSARTLGIDKLADMAYEHECRCKEGNIIYIQDHYEELMYEWNRSVKIIREYLSNGMLNEERQDTTSMKEMSEEEWNNRKKELLKYIEAFKKKEALQLVEELLSYKMDSEESEKMQKIHKALKEYDYETAAMLLAGIKKGN